MVGHLCLLVFMAVFSGQSHSAQLGDGVAPSVPQAFFNMSDPMETRQSNGQQPQVRVGIKLLPFIHAKIQNLNGEIGEIVRPGTETTRTLRMRMNSPNHFVIGDYHIESEPLSYIKATRQFEVRLKLAKRLGLDAGVEESLGHLDVKGVLAGDNGVYILKGASAKQFLDQMGRPALKVIAGQGDATVISDSLSEKSNGDSKEKNKVSNRFERAHLPGSPKGL